MKRAIVGLVLLLGLVVACGAPAPQAANTASEAPAAAPQAPVAGEADFGGQQGDVSVTERMIIRTVDLSLVVTDAEQVRDAVSDLVTSLDGYIADASAWREGEQVRARMTVRVPAAQLDATLAALKSYAVRVETENIRGQDVTEEFSDLTAQLTNLEATELELRTLLTEVRERTQSAEDILAVYRELTRIRGEIEQVKGRMQYLDTMTALATINLELIPDVLAKPVVEPGWRPLETLKAAGRALVNSVQFLGEAIIWIIVYVLPLLILIALPIVLLVLALRWLIRRLRNRAKG